jgi:hypothetical protein
MPLIAGSLPPNTCYGTPQQLLDLFGAYLSLPGQNLVLEGKLSTTFGLTVGATPGAGATGTATLTVSGASSGDPVIIGFPANQSGIVYDAFVSGPNVVTLRATYISATKTVPPAATYTVKVLKFGGVYP